ncbi:MAG: energy transducer TonB, partial [Gammaproteobacteria bacterium]|nr:energy transducer TonB [Gammaproteobacteria bacterium]
RSLILLLLVPVAALAQQVEVETFTVPRPVERAVPDYPGSQAMRGGEGLVFVDFMVGTDGKAFDPVVVESSGDEDFHEAALEALSESTFEPATLSGEPIVGSMRVLYRFDMEGDFGEGASPAFVSAFRRLQRALEEQDSEEIEARLARLESLETRNHYEYAFLGLARYSHAVLYGTPRQRLDHLRQALSVSWSPEDRLYLDEDLVRDLRRAQLSLMLQLNFFAEAIKTFELMQENEDAEGIAAFRDVIATVEALKHDDSEYFIPLELDESGSASVLLFKNRFALTEGEGDLAEAVLRCERQYVAFQVERDISYDVPGDWGECSLQILGDSSANFFLMQH